MRKKSSMMDVIKNSEELYKNSGYIQSLWCIHSNLESLQSVLYDVSLLFSTTKLENTTEWTKKSKTIDPEKQIQYNRHESDDKVTKYVQT